MMYEPGSCALLAVPAVSSKNRIVAPPWTPCQRGIICNQSVAAAGDMLHDVELPSALQGTGVQAGARRRHPSERRYGAMPG